MPGKENFVVNVRREVLARVARLFWEGCLVEEIDRIPYLMRPRDFKEKSRCCLYKDRAVLRDRILALLPRLVANSENLAQNRPQWRLCAKVIF